VTIPVGKAHSQWKKQKEAETKKGTADVNKLFKLDFGPTLEKFDAAVKAGDRSKASGYAQKLNGIIPKYVTASSKLKTASEFKTLLKQLQEYVTENYDACLPTKAPSAYKYMKQGGDGLCAFYALYHYTNGGIAKDKFLKEAAKYYKTETGVDDKLAASMAKDGNDPALIPKLGPAAASFGGKDAYIVADVNKGHFWTIRKVDDFWWLYDGLKGKPEVIGSDDDAKQHVGGKQLFG